ncbi:MAG: hypothetical protein K5773_09335 [Pseudobutyrivibrio sp.]|nr:hypothetical protein [Pseudobutyrivibrio sp.]
MSAIVRNEEPIEVICQFKQDGTIIPRKMRVSDEDGLYQEYTVRGYRRMNPKYTGMACFACKIVAFHQEKVVNIAYNYNTNVWFKHGFW